MCTSTGIATNMSTGVATNIPTGVTTNMITIITTNTITIITTNTTTSLFQDNHFVRITHGAHCDLTEITARRHAEHHVYSSSPHCSLTGVAGNLLHFLSLYCVHSHFAVFYSSHRLRRATRACHHALPVEARVAKKPIHHMMTLLVSSHLLANRPQLLNHIVLQTP